jgi:predicted benzoate:H+ symporter BenE
MSTERLIVIMPDVLFTIIAGIALISMYRDSPYRKNRRR